VDGWMNEWTDIPCFHNQNFFNTQGPQSLEENVPLFLCLIGWGNPEMGGFGCHLTTSWLPGLPLPGKT
jgi:hypothetical protein